jgi:ribonuclease P protein component
MAIIHKYTFGKEERLKSSIRIARLFATGHSLAKYPFKVFWDYEAANTQTVPVKIAISVPKKNFRKAVDRNLIKRRLREVHRKNKFILADVLKEKNIQIVLIVLYLPDKILEYNEIHTGYVRLLKELLFIISAADA